MAPPTSPQRSKTGIVVLTDGTKVIAAKAAVLNLSILYFVQGKTSAVAQWIEHSSPKLANGEVEGSNPL
jgi:hypothetical protein